jgi:hypothetical protein
MHHRKPLFGCLVAGAFLSVAVTAAPVSSCAPDFSSCTLYPDTAISFPGLAISGDVLVQVGPATIADFRIDNDFIDTGGGTGLGDRAFFYGELDLPLPVTYSANVLFIPRGTTGPPGYYDTVYNGNGTLYNLLTPSPEPPAVALVTAGALLLAIFRPRHGLADHFRSKKAIETEPEASAT